ncbi:MAG: NFACT family protein, partial [Clostridia bacterium]|nr:NFACT family protein [Clostridia bacterium]
MMAFDGLFTGKIALELSEAVNSHIDKIYQPSGDEIILGLRKKGFSKKLLLSAKSGMARVHFTEIKWENPEKPPMFCMLFRKHYQGARLLSVKAVG